MSSATAIHSTSVYLASGPSIRYPHGPRISTTCILGADIFGLSLMLWAFLGNTTLGRYIVPGSWLPLWPLLPLFIVLYAFADLYPGVSVNPIDEIRSISLANAFAFLFIAMVLTLHRPAVMPQLTCLSCSIGASAVILVMRSLVRTLCSQFRWWGYPVVLFGGGAAARSLLHKLANQPCLGLRLVAVVADQSTEREIDGIPVYNSQYLGRIASCGVRHAIIAAPELSQSEFARFVERCGDSFPRLILIPNMDSIWKVGAHTRELTAVLGLHVQNNLLDGRSRMAKRAMDLASATILLLLAFPLLAIISLAIIVDSGNPVFYFDERLGYRGKTFRMWKFRTMVKNSREVLAHAMANDPRLQKEWAENHKLRKDPRVTKVGRILRKTSLDEVPQLWNVIKGEMSLVGPRPIVKAEVAKYRETYALYSKTTPGLTGLWQVSGRNHTTYAERVAYDTFYVRNWSVWLDVYLLAQTARVVLTGDGAY